MTAMQITFFGKESRQCFSVVGIDRKDVIDTAFELADQTEIPRAVVCKPINLTRETTPCAN